MHLQQKMMLPNFYTRIMEKVEFEYELQMSDEVQNMYNEMSEATVLPIIVPSLLNACRGMERDMERSIIGFYNIFKEEGKRGLHKAVNMVGVMNGLSANPSEDEIQQAIKEITAIKSE